MRKPFKVGFHYFFGVNFLPSEGNMRADSLQSKRASSAERCSAEKDPSVRKLLKELLAPPQRNGVLEIKKYANTNFVSLILEKSFYEEFERDSLELGVSTENSALKALEEYHEKIKKTLALKKLEEKRAHLRIEIISSKLINSKFNKELG